jgi:hypothetical protein
MIFQGILYSQEPNKNSISLAKERERDFIFNSSINILKRIINVKLVVRLY